MPLTNSKSLPYQFPQENSFSQPVYPLKILLLKTARRCHFVPYNVVALINVTKFRENGNEAKTPRKKSEERKRAQK